VGAGVEKEATGRQVSGAFTANGLALDIFKKVSSMPLENPYRYSGFLRLSGNLRKYQVCDQKIEGRTSGVRRYVVAIEVQGKSEKKGKWFMEAN